MRLAAKLSKGNHRVKTEDVNIHPLINHPQILKADVSIGVRKLTNKAKACLVFLASDSWSVYQINFNTFLPSLMTKPVSKIIFI